MAPKQRERLLAETPPPEVEAHFAATEYPRFVSQLVETLGQGEAWARYEAAQAHQVQLIGQQWYKHLKPATPAELAAAQARLAEAKAQVTALSANQPILRLALMPANGVLDSAACVEFAPLLRQAAAQWAPAPSGRLGWREQALLLADAMDWVAAHPPYCFFIAG